MNDVMLVNVQLSRGLECAAEARRAVERELHGLVSPHILDDVRTVVSELATSAYRRSGGRIMLQVGLLGRRLRIDVVDEGRDLARDLERHRGLAGTDLGADARLPLPDGLKIVEEIALACGVAPESRRAWAELPLDG